MWTRMTPYFVAILLFLLGTLRLQDRGDTVGAIINGFAAVSVVVGLVVQFVHRRRNRDGM